MARKISTNVALAITLIAMTMTFSVTWIIAKSNFEARMNQVVQRSTLYNKVAEIDAYARTDYYGDIDENYLLDRLGRGYIDGLGDPYSTYYTAAEYTEMQEIAAGTRVGIGIEVFKNASGYFQIARVYPDSPAETAGLAPNMLITSIDGTDTRTISTNRNMRSRLMDRPGTEITLECVPNVGTDGTQVERTVYTIQRANFTPPTVELYDDMPNNYAYIRISTITDASVAELDYAVREAESRGAFGLVFDLRNFDLRNNAAAQFEPVYQMIDRICPRGVIAKAQLKSGVVQILRASDAENRVDLPMVCIVNGSTAGAAELFAVSVRDLAGGQLVGSTTAGRGTLQRLPRVMTDGSAVSITYALLLTGKDETFHGVGLQPEVEVPANLEDEFSIFNPNLQGDNQILRAFELAAQMARAAGIDTGSPPVISQPASGDSSGAGSDAATGESTAAGSEPDPSATSESNNESTVSSG